MQWHSLKDFISFNQVRIHRGTLSQFPTYGDLFQGLASTTGEIPIAIYRTEKQTPSLLEVSHCKEKSLLMFSKCRRASSPSLSAMKSYDPCYVTLTIPYVHRLLTCLPSISKIVIPQYHNVKLSSVLSSGFPSTVLFTLSPSHDLCNKCGLPVTKLNNQFS